MKRTRQKTEDILAQLSELESGWRDEFADAVIAKIFRTKDKRQCTRSDIEELLSVDNVILDGSDSKKFEVGLTAARLFLDLSKDRFSHQLKHHLGDLSIGITSATQSPDRFFGALEQLGLKQAMEGVINAPVSWKDILQERLKGGRGSAITGQQRGRDLEDFVESVVRKVFGADNYQARCRFSGANGLTNEKCDFAIPHAEDPVLLIEAKAYGATGSKQTDIGGDIEKISDKKRDDTYLLLFTDGLTWASRKNDLRRLVQLQNEGRIYKIYTKKMIDTFETDLLKFKQSFAL